jgi:hypothetical protein
VSSSCSLSVSCLSVSSLSSLSTILREFLFFCSRFLFLDLVGLKGSYLNLSKFYSCNWFSKRKYYSVFFTLLFFSIWKRKTNELLTLKKKHRRFHFRANWDPLFGDLKLRPWLRTKWKKVSLLNNVFLNSTRPLN